jgi:hypothetical protein
MPSKISLAFVLAILNLTIFCQTKPLGAVCNISGNKIDPDYLMEHSTAVSKTEKIYGYIDRLLDIKSTENTNFQIYNVKDSIVASSYLRPGDIVQKAIYLNVDYYKQLLQDSMEREALFTFLIGHEFSHHIFEDVQVNTKDDLFENFRRELRADERAGYYVAKMTEVDIDFFDKIIPLILNNTEHGRTHPARQFRILAAKAGWFSGKLENKPQHSPKIQQGFVPPPERFKEYIDVDMSLPYHHYTERNPYAYNSVIYYQ